MLGWAIAVALLALLVLLAFHRPTLARMGIGYALQRKRRTALVVGGLMVATTVLVAAGIAADSSARSFTESLLARVYLTDATATGYGGDLLSAETVEGVVVDPSLSQGVAAHATAIRLRLAVESGLSGMGDKDVAVWGIDPASFGKVARYEKAEGQPPTRLAEWPDATAVVNRLAATRFGLAVGDDVNVFLAGRELVLPNSTPYEGRWELSAQAPVTGAFVHNPQDRYEFDYETKDGYRGGSLTFVATTASDVEIQLTVVDPVENSHTEGPTPGRAEIRLPVEFSAGSVYHVVVESPRAVRQDFILNVTEDVRRMVDDRALTARVVGVIESPGSDPLGAGPAVFLPLPAMQAFLSAPDRVNTLLVDFRDDGDLEGLSNSFRQVARKAWGGQSADVRTDRAEVERQRTEIEQLVETTFIGIGSFSILAGFMLIGVLVALLVEERKQILATARALGAQRLDLTRMHAHEGALYAALAAAAGLAAGAAVAALTMRYVSALFPEADTRFVLLAKPDTVFSAAGFGFVLVLVVMVFSAYRATRIHLVSALRGGTEEAPHRARRVVIGILLALLGGLVWALGVVDGATWAHVLGSTLVALGIAPLAARLLGRDLGATLPAALLAGYLVFILRTFSVGRDADTLVFPLCGVLLAGCLAVVAAYSGWVHALVLRGFAFTPRTRPFAATALGHLRQRPGRAALTIAMFGTVLVVLTTLGTLFTTLSPNDLGDGGGFDVLADTPRSLGDPAQYLRDNPSASGRDPLQEAAGWLATPWIPDGVRELQEVVVTGDGQERRTTAGIERGPVVTRSAAVVTASWAQRVDLDASALAPGHADLRAAFLAVERDASVIVVAEGFGFYDFESRGYVLSRVGDTVQAGQGDAAVDVRIIGIVADSGMAGAYVHPTVGALLAESSGLSEMGTRVWATARTDPQRLAESFEAAYRRVGMSATLVDDIDPADREATEAVQSIVGVFVGLGIVIGMVSLALIMGRNVLLRRAEIGTLRALGAQPGDVLLMFSFEALYLAAWSILIGLSVGLLLAAGMTTPFATGGLKVDWANLLGLYGFTALAALVAAFLPAWRASRLRPAQAVRYVE